MNIQVPEGPFEAYIFDCDGTLADSMPAHYEAFKRAFQALKHEFHFDEELYYSWAGQPIEVVVDKLNKLHGLEMDHTQVGLHKNRFYRDTLDAVEPIESVVDILREAAGKIRIAVASGGTRECVTKTLKNIGVFDQVEALVCAEDVERGKPAPDVFLKAADMLGVPPQRCLVFEDGILGIEGADAAGMQSVFIDSRA